MPWQRYCVFFHLNRLALQQSRFGDNLLLVGVLCAPKGNAVLKGLHRARPVSKKNPVFP